MSDAIIQFAPAIRKGSHVLISLYGYSGCGKTLSALYIARGLVGPKGRVGMLDSETQRGLVYSDDPLIGGYEYAELTAPFSPERYSQSIRIAEEAGINALVIDSGSHEWQSVGGVLESAEANGYQGLVKWAKPKARHGLFVQTLLNARMHIVVALRAKERLVQVERNNKKEIVSAGMVPIQDKQFIYETTVQVYLPIPAKPTDPRGVAIIEKCPRALLGAFPAGQQVSVKTGEAIAEWVRGGAPVDDETEKLKQKAHEIAAEGLNRMTTWWSGLSTPQRKMLESIKGNLKSIAEDADKRPVEAPAVECGCPDAPAGIHLRECQFFVDEQTTQRT